MRQQEISFCKEGVALRLPNRQGLSIWLGEVVRLEGKELGPLTFVYCSDTYLRSVNRKYLNINNITDVITFGYNVDNVDNEVSGDVFISVDRVRENAAYYKVPFHTELRRIMVHGVLHLIGYRDKIGEEKALMTEKEDLYLSLHLK